MMSPRKTRKSSSPPAPAAPAATHTEPHAAFLDDGGADAHERGERKAEPREDELIGTSGSHSGAPDSRAEEPAGELAPSAAAQGGDD